MWPPQIWLISVGIALLVRRYLYKIVFKESKLFNKTAGIVCVSIGAIWFITIVAIKWMNYNTTKNLLERYELTEKGLTPKSNNTVSNDDALLQDFHIIDKDEISVNFL